MNEWEVGKETDHESIGDLFSVPVLFLPAPWGYSWNLSPYCGESIFGLTAVIFDREACEENYCVSMRRFYYPCAWATLIFEGSLEVKLPTIWRDEKAVSREKSQKRKDQKKEDAGARKGRKVAKHCVSSWFCGSGGSKSRLAKAAGAETSGEMRDEKLHAVVARSRFRSEKVQNTSAPDRFWKLRCWKSAWRCGAKHIWK